MKIKRKASVQAFTLSEVLLVLSVIGVVSALTIPSLITNINDNQYKIAWKKSFEDLSQVSQRMLADNRGSLSGMFTSANSMRDKFANYLNVIKSCDSTTTMGNCWNNNGSGKLANGNIINNWNSYPIGQGTNANNAGLVLNNGSLLKFVFTDTACTVDYTMPRCGAIYIDVNGFKSPNQVGKDIFGVHVVKDGISAYGTPVNSAFDEFTTDCGAGATYGIGCSASVLYQ